MATKTRSRSKRAGQSTVDEAARPSGFGEEPRGYEAPTADRPAKSTRIEARISPLGLRMIKRAAEIQGRSVSDFVVAAAQEAAQRTIAETHIIKLSLDDQRALAEALLNPPEPGPALRKAREAHRRLIRESR